ncbi:YihY/virulence factor BrkB family protein [Portibacter marinus]|uniref:YihY/virulence factor BrkB family protein n=1 Tax=Portibacter marinus TaxID=2898660 RepID=UPI001F16FD46|nr:YihY/virulence factor BrkB family protein [Portibacter marinus]
MATRLKRTLILLRDTGQSFFQKDPMTYGASIAFYTLISLPAITLLISMLIGTAYQSDNVQDKLLQQLHQFMGQSSVETVDMILENAGDLGETWWAKAITIGTLVFSATTVFISLQNALNNIWNLKPKPESSIVKYLVNRLLSFAMVVSLGFLLLVTLAVDSVVLLIENYLTDLLSGAAMVLVQTLNFTISLILTTFLFALIFKFLPDAEIKWRQVRLGGLVTAILFIIGKYLLGIYLSFSDVGSAYGAAGSLVLFLTWIYYSSIILLFGANFTYVYAKLHDNYIQPSKHATFVEEKEVENMQ